MLIAGIGCRRGTSFEALLGLLEHGLAGRPLGAVQGLASIEQKQHEPGLQRLAQHLGLPLAVYSAARLSAFDSQLSHRSAASLRHTGCAGVAESAALAHCQHLTGRPAALSMPRLASAEATLALAEPLLLHDA
ncbi:cobalamin biosynthesis protein [Pseudomonas typographi]|uniref:Cobalamin biosynthesis protein n=1 Tax=Pseudomonas typographi TaxID=2715964 RepID=A0ABR7YX55_9PSED|nr:cobalamin biosynthesis protein [Pseudomonas typographi]MBD1551202.1 cobalamin biosynthesis protein [Pseudomonas typographi]MBD1586304.1 cobalamin biosynthesis protein [Pseudomonas typographi]MBD1597776.1 cobalamin biosynthesis protein [Pseudomonas typographi]